ncbi:MAG: HAMP domain-containing sensor histidine kinase [Bacteroidales bacterium]
MPETHILITISALVIGTFLLYLLCHKYYRMLLTNCLQREEESRKMQLKLEEALQRSKEAEQLKTAFLSNINHEIRTPLNAIVGFSNLITEEDDPNTKKELSDIINSNCNQLLCLLEDILHLSKLQTGSMDLNPEWFDFSSYFDTVFSQLQTRLPQDKISFINKNPYSTYKVNLDKRELTRVITKIVMYAAKLTTQGFIEIGYEKEKDGVRIYVTDSGTGIQEEQLPRVFDWFYQDNHTISEEGLEMPLCKAIVEAQGGEVGVRSRLGSGSTYWIWLPSKVEQEVEVMN